MFGMTTNSQLKTEIYKSRAMASQHIDLLRMEVEAEAERLRTEIRNWRRESMDALVTLTRAIETLNGRFAEMSHATEAVEVLTAKVDRLVTVNSSAIELLDGLATLIRAHANEPTALLELADTIDAQNAAMAAAVERNTITAPVDPEDPSEEEEDEEEDEEG